MQERILVTGGTGFIGGYLCERLATRGNHVRTLARDPERCANLHDWGVEVVIGDLRDRGSLERAVKGIDVVYHIAALFRQENVSPKDFRATNVEGTQNLLNASIIAGVSRFIHCSSVAVHGNVKHPPADETTPYGPIGTYQESKTSGEQVVLDCMAKEHFPIVVFRPGGIYGPRDLRFLKLFKAIKMRRFAMLGSGQVLYQFIYIDDLIDGILLCGTREEAVGNIYILTGKEPVTLNYAVHEIADVVGVPPPWLRLPVAPVYLAGYACELVCKPFGIEPPLYRRRVNFFRHNRAFSIDKAERELGFQPKVDLKMGLRRTAEWYVRQELL